MKQTKNRLYVLVGNFGVGKTSIVNYYPHSFFNEFFTQVNGLLSVGGKNGCDALSAHSKEEVFNMIKEAKEHRLLVHGIYYMGKIDLLRYRKTHNPLVIFLRTDKETNGLRIIERGKRINEDTWYQKEIGNKNLLQFCVDEKINFRVVDNNKPLEEVAKQVWGIISSS